MALAFFVKNAARMNSWMKSSQNCRNEEHELATTSETVLQCKWW
jgi:hypothetical protein